MVLKEIIDKKYVCYWGDGYIDSPESKVVEKTFFKEKDGYDNNDIPKILALKIGETIDLSDMTGVHIIMRVE